MSTTFPNEKPASWSGLLGCLGVGLLVIGLIVSVFLYFKGRTTKTEVRITAEFIEPYLAALRSDDPATVWQTLTTEAYRQRHSQEVHAANFHLVRQRLGLPETVIITSVTTTHEPGRSYQAVVTRWKCPHASEFYRSFKLIDVPGQGYRLDEATLGGRHGQITPSEIPLDPW